MCIKGENEGILNKLVSMFGMGEKVFFHIYMYIDDIYTDVD